MTQPPYGNYPPPPAGGFGDYPSAPATFNVGDALTYGWTRFKDNPGVWIGIVLLTLVVSGGLNAIGNGTRESAYGVAVLFSIVSVLVSWYLQAAVTRGSLDEADGKKPAFGDFFQLRNVGQILLTSFLVSVMVAVGLILLIIPGIIVGFLSFLAVQFVVDQKLPAFEAIKASWSLTSKNAGPLVLLALAVIGLNLVGLLLCVVGLLVTLPVTGIAISYAYRSLSGTKPGLA